MKETKIYKKFTPLNVVLFTILLLAATFYIVLFTWGILTTFKTQNEFRLNVFGLPKKWAWDNYVLVFNNFYVPVTYPTGTRKVMLLEMAFNTVIYAVSGALSSVGVKYMCAYVTSKYKFWFNKVMVNIVIITMIVPIIGSGVAGYKLFRDLGLYNTYFFRAIASFSFLGMDFLVFRGVFKGISDDYMDAARLDGCGELRILLTIMFPLTKAMFMTYFFLGFIGLYNDFGTIKLYTPGIPTLSYAILEIATSTRKGFTTVPVRLSGAFMLAVPISILFILVQKKLLINVNVGGLKE